MISLKQAKEVSKGFVKEACEFLEIDAYSIRMIYTPIIETNISIFQNILILDKEDSMVVSEAFLNHCIQTGITTLRVNIYAIVRLISERRKGPNNFDLNNYLTIFYAFQYAKSIMILKGLSLVCPPDINPHIFFSPILNILKDEFDLIGYEVKDPLQSYNGIEIYKVQLCEKDTEKIYRRYYKPYLSTVRDIRIGEKGSFDNPYDNIYDAVKYLKKAEEDAYKTDSLMQEIASQKYFYDCNHGSFRIMWAHPNAAHLKNFFPPKSFILTQMDTHFFSLKPNLYKHKFLYRGQNDSYPETPCVPNIYRNEEHNNKGNYLDYIIFSQELEILAKSHPLAQLLEKGIYLLHDKFRIRMNYYGLTQHYYNKSNFLDLTSDIEVAKFFATTNYNFKTDEYCPFKDSNKIGVIYYYELLFPNAFQEHDGYSLKTIGKQLYMRSGAQNGFLLQMSKGVDFKKLPEVKAVYFKHNTQISEDVFEACNKGQNYFAEDLLQHAWYNRMKQRYEEKIVSKKAVELNVMRNEGETIESIMKKLNEYGIKVDDFNPKFTDEELDIYYQSIQKGWWNDFCSDIYFYSAECELYREELKNINTKSEYKWAFEK